MDEYAGCNISRWQGYTTAALYDRLSEAADACGRYANRRNRTAPAKGIRYFSRHDGRGSSSSFISGVFC